MIDWIRRAVAEGGARGRLGDPELSCRGHVGQLGLNGLVSPFAPLAIG